MEFESLPAGWEIWTQESTKVVLTYRPDVFDSDAFPAACLPTIHLTKGTRSRRPGRNTPDPEDPWYVRLYLEPEVSGDRTKYDDSGTARDEALALAEAFGAGAVDYRGLYQVPRPEYLDRLDELTGGED